jgi:hypothetical protein
MHAIVAVVALVCVAIGFFALAPRRAQDQILDGDNEPPAVTADVPSEESTGEVAEPPVPADPEDEADDDSDWPTDFVG